MQSVNLTPPKRELMGPFAFDSFYMSVTYTVALSLIYLQSVQ